MLSEVLAFCGVGGVTMQPKFEVDGAEAKLLGVCAGLAKRFSVNATLLRIVLVLVTIVGGFPWTLIAYAIAGWYGGAEFGPALSGAWGFRQGLVPLALGSLLAAALLIFVNHVNVLGVSCYYVGELAMSSACIKSEYYRGAWVVVVALLGWGLFRLGPGSVKKD